MKRAQEKIILSLSLAFFLCLPFFTSAAFLGQKENFFIESSYDSLQREKISATLLKIGQKAYFFIDDNYFNSLTAEERTKIYQSIEKLDNEFYLKIYPTLTSYYGSEWTPGIDNENNITILFHTMSEEAGGYFRAVDEYEKIQIPNSNQREMIYLNATYSNNPQMKSLLAHEFTHLITFNQKNKKQQVEEDTWLNEARAEFAPTLLGYDNDYQNSNLQKRVKKFLEKPNDSITEWQGLSADYGALNLFVQYLVEQHGVKILTDSIKLKSVGIKSINEALDKNGFSEDFSEIFTNWTITLAINDCSLGKQFCYQNENLKNLQVVPSFNFLPLKTNNTLTSNQTTKNWSGNWSKLIGGGGEGNLKIKFVGTPEVFFKVPYILKDNSGKTIINYFNLNEYQRGEISVSQFGKETLSLILCPSIQSKLSDFTNPEPSFPFFWEASTTTQEKTESPSVFLDKPISEMSQDELMLKINQLQQLLVQLQSQFNELTKGNTYNNACYNFQENLFYGLRNNEEVRYLQQFLKDQGSDIYPEGLVTGNFLSLTKAAVVRFQQKYKEEILTPLGLTKGTGYVGIMTIKKINQLCTLLTLR